MNKPTVLPPPKDQSELATAIDKMSRMLPEHQRLCALVAQQDMVQFQAWMQAGFTRSDALELLKATKMRVTIGKG